jgi:hypothetical protein
LLLLQHVTILEGWEGGLSDEDTDSDTPVDTSKHSRFSTATATAATAAAGASGNGDEHQSYVCTTKKPALCHRARREATAAAAGVGSGSATAAVVAAAVAAAAAAASAPPALLAIRMSNVRAELKDVQWRITQTSVSAHNCCVRLLLICASQ